MNSSGGSSTSSSDQEGGGQEGMEGGGGVSVLKKNASIPVTIDNLAEGLLVVSFTHGDNLYQGVLFMLNRERGIPCGISFPKEDPSPCCPGEKLDGDLSQPVSQRHTYNPGSSIGIGHTCSSNGGGAGGIGIGARFASQPSLRRVIKPPARFKNARMSLRLRARPILCAKCKTLCEEDKSEGQEDKERSTPSPSSIPPSYSFSNKDSNQKQSKVTFSSGSINTGESSPQDLNYKSVGNTRVVANYWKRPLPQPLISSSEEIYTRLRKNRGQNNENQRNTRKSNQKEATVTRASGSSCSKGGTTTSASKSKGKVTCDDKECTPTGNRSNSKEQKALNLKLCITRLSEMRTRRGTASGGNGGFAARLKRVRKAASPRHQLQNQSSNSSSPPYSAPTVFVPPKKTKESATSLTCSASAASATSSKKKGSKKKSNKAWKARARHHQIDASSSSSSVNKNEEEDEEEERGSSAQSNEESSVEENGIPVLTISRLKTATSSISPDSRMAPSTSSAGAVGPISINQFSLEGSSSSDSSSNVISSTTLNPAPAISIASTASTSSTVSSGSTASGCGNGGLGKSMKNLSSIATSSDVIKTPSIKISFGGHHNEMVVQIPPKLASQKRGGSDSEDEDARAARKALKKARKEAKRKRSSSPTDLPDPHRHEQFPSNGEVSQSNGGDVRGYLETDEETAKPCSSSSAAQNEEDRAGSGGSERSKKKKKQKKRRRSRSRSKNVPKHEESFEENENEYLNLHPHHHYSFLENGGGMLEGEGGENGEEGEVEGQPQYIIDEGDDGAVSSPIPSVSPPHVPFKSLEEIPPTPPNQTPNQRVCINLRRVNQSRDEYASMMDEEIDPQGEGMDYEDDNEIVEVDDEEIDERDIERDIDEAVAAEDSQIGNEDEDENELDIDFPEMEFPGEGPEDEEDEGCEEEELRSVEVYQDKETEYVYQVGQIVWAKLSTCPWWPAKITDILVSESDRAKAKISWYKSKTESCIRFTMILPFAENFDRKYTSSRRRGLYQKAVNAAMMEACRINSDGNQLTEST